MEIQERANKYASEKTNEVMIQAIAQAYRDGYQDGYKDCEKEIPIEFQKDKTEFVDLGLPSGTLWAADYEKKDDQIMYLPYDKASTLSIPTEEQWQELLEMCKWESHYAEHRCDCIGPNGNFISFNECGFLTTNVKRESHNIYFWIIDKDDNIDKKAIFMHYSNYSSRGIQDIKKICQQFSGYGLSVRLVRKKG